MEGVREGTARQGGQALRRATAEFLVFGLKQARACVFAGSFMLVLALSHRVPLFGMARYDFILLAAIAIQAVLLLTRIETWDEARVIAVFHAIGLALELFKTHPSIGSWSYPEDCLFKIGRVPLYSGFMYAAVGSYMCQAWRIFDLELVNYPPHKLSVPLAAAIYANFFTHHWIWDFRWVLAGLVLVVFWRTWVLFTVTKARRRMPLALSFLLIGFFIWVAENISTYFGAWVYPDQAREWRLVGPGKISSWALLVIISFILVADLKRLKATLVRMKAEAQTPPIPGP